MQNTDNILNDIVLEVSNIAISYGNKKVVDNISFCLKKGEISCLIGESGVGKTTVLRSIAGFEPITSGNIKLNGNIISSPSKIVAPEMRKVAMVFQDYALLPHLNVEENISFGIRKMDTRKKQQRVQEMIELVKLNRLNRYYPHQLSGGQQQRIAIARALAPAPKLLLLDEPFSNLDPNLREEISIDIYDILTKSQTTTLLVTHSQKEAFALADNIGVMVDNFFQWDSAYKIYHEPETHKIGAFVGGGAFLPGRVNANNCVDLELGLNYQLTNNFPKDMLVDVLIRPNNIQHDPESLYKGVIKSSIFRGPSFLYTLLLVSGREVKCLLPSHLYYNIGDSIHISLKRMPLKAFPNIK